MKTRKNPTLRLYPSDPVMECRRRRASRHQKVVLRSRESRQEMKEALR